tara:strand:+ start:1218 stop:1496 length:279 start_codon:yes stop_codon:yes gene_type:complete
MIKDNLILNLSKKTGFSNKFSKKLVDDFLNVIAINIKTNRCVLKNLGTFKLINKKERLGRNPKTKKEYLISERKVVSFIVSKKITKALNKDL